MNALKMLFENSFGYDRVWLDHLVTSAVEFGRHRVLLEVLEIKRKLHSSCDRGFGSKALALAIITDMPNLRQKIERSEQSDFLGQNPLQSGAILLSFGVDPLFMHRLYGHEPGNETQTSSALSYVIRCSGRAQMLKWLSLILDKGTRIDAVVEVRAVPAYEDTSYWVTSDKNEVIGFNPLLLAISEKDISTVRLLLGAGADINLPATEEPRRTPLQAACESENFDIFSLLSNQGANFNAPAASYKGGTALQLAAICGNLSMGYELLSRNATVNAAGANFGGRTALEGAAEHGMIGVLETLLDPDCGGAKTSGDEHAQYQRAMKLAEDNGMKKASFMLKCAHERMGREGANVQAPSSLTELEPRAAGWWLGDLQASISISS